MLRRKVVSPKELLDFSYARMDQVGKAVNATVIQCRERAYAQLDAVKDLDPSEPGWLGGLPIGIKDLNDVSGVKTTMGSWGLRDNIASVSTPLVETIEARGGIITGKTNTPEFGAGGNTFNDVFGYTRNPWDTSKNAGGSSGGAAASLAVGETWLSHGSDLAGSCRTPAAYCGVVGLRPSPGRAGGGPGPAGFLNEGISGPMARDVEDCALFLDNMTGFDPRIPLSLDAPAVSFQDALKQDKKNIRIAFSEDQGGFAPVEREVREILSGAMKIAGKSGITVEEGCPNMPALYDSYIALRGMHYGAVNNFVPDSVKKYFKSTLRDNIDVGIKQTSHDIYLAQRGRTEVYNQMLDFLTDFDVFAIPVVGLEPGPVEQEWPPAVDGVQMPDYVDWLRFSFLATTAALPALAMPAGFTKSGMPIGIQLIGPPRGDALLLQVGLALERALNLPKKPIDPNITHC
ncbi:MAG: amidase [Rhodobacteraceae bacterium]|nr:amidase [Paracoccaceae bacterium]